MRAGRGRKMAAMNIARCLAGALVLAAGASGFAAAEPAAEPQARVIVRLKPGAAALREHVMTRQHGDAAVHQLAQRRADTLTRHMGRPLTSGRMLSTQTQVLMAQGVDSATLAAQLRRHPDVAYAVVDQRRRSLRVPNDPLYMTGPPSGLGPAVGQWYLRPPSAQVPAAINAEEAWDRVNVNAALVVAVLDTGILADHPDLAGRVLPGYDMISDVPAANDGNGRDANASDPGDWVTAAENSDRRGDFYQCGVANSDWHGTKTAGLIGAIADNGQGIAGAAAGVRILPVRVLGKCGGYDSDIAAGMLWAAGLDVPGLPRNATPARVLSLSLGGEGVCEAVYQDAMQAVTEAGVVVVVSAGNSTGRAVGSPANCPGAIAVAGLRHVGSKVGFSDLGPEVTISAPAGNCINIGAGEPCLFPIATTSNLGTRAPVAGGSTWTDSYNASVGTSYASPLVAATVALMLSARADLTPAQVVDALKRSARPFPTTGGDNGDGTVVPMCRAPDGTDQLQCYCRERLCGAGMLDALAAVQTVLTPEAPEELARQLMNFGERAYPQFFPQRPATQVSKPFVYRYHPATGVHIGVVVHGGTSYVMDGVYVLGGPFGPAPVYVGQVRDFITPSMPAAASARATAGAPAPGRR
jgi:serine protease